mgnify:CR=1 FL=1
MSMWHIAALALAAWGAIFGGAVLHVIRAMGGA